MPCASAPKICFRMCTACRRKKRAPAHSRRIHEQKDEKHKGAAARYETSKGTDTARGTDNASTQWYTTVCTRCTQPPPVGSPIIPVCGLLVGTATRPGAQAASHCVGSGSGKAHMQSLQTYQGHNAA